MQVATFDLSPNFRLRRESTADDFEDAKFHEFKKAQQRSTSCPHLIETDTLKTERFAERSETALGAGGRAFKSPRPDQ